MFPAEQDTESFVAGGNPWTFLAFVQVNEERREECLHLEVETSSTKCILVTIQGHFHPHVNTDSVSV